LVDAALGLARPPILPPLLLPAVALPTASVPPATTAPALSPSGTDPAKQHAVEPPLRIAIVGRPNVGKSTLVNRLAGESRVLAHDAPGTTRDAIAVPIERRGKAYVLIDTAGVRRRARISAALEKLTVVKSLQSIGAAQAVVLMLDATAGVTEQDLTLLGHVLEAGSALTIAVNKWDALDEDERDRVRRELDRRLVFAPYARVCTLSALEGSGIGQLFAALERAWSSATVRLSSSDLTRRLAGAVAANPPPLVRGRRIKLRYAHQGGGAPPIIIVHGNQTDAVPESYRRYLTNYYRREMGLEGTPLRVEFRTGDNPFKGRRNKLTPRQERKRRRLMKHRKR
ncbi:MAG: ribosome biogenesis GTPase Der, partial [Gammaproteobacteria bacterium]